MIWLHEISGNRRFPEAMRGYAPTDSWGKHGFPHAAQV